MERRAKEPSLNDQIALMEERDRARSEREAVRASPPGHHPPSWPDGPPIREWSPHLRYTLLSRPTHADPPHPCPLRIQAIAVMLAEQEEREKRASGIPGPTQTEEEERHQAAAKLQAVQRGRAARRLTVNSALAADDTRRVVLARAASAREMRMEEAGEAVEDRVQKASSYFVRVKAETKPKRKRVQGARVSTFRDASPGRDLPSQVRARGGSPRRPLTPARPPPDRPTDVVDELSSPSVADPPLPPLPPHRMPPLPLTSRHRRPPLACRCCCSRAKGAQTSSNSRRGSSASGSPHRCARRRSRSRRPPLWPQSARWPPGSFRWRCALGFRMRRPLRSSWRWRRAWRPRWRRRKRPRKAPRGVATQCRPRRCAWRRHRRPRRRHTRATTRR